MKKLRHLLAIVLFSTTATAQIEYNEERVEFTKLINVSEIICVIRPGRNISIQTEISDLSNIKHDSIVMKHYRATTLGCELQTLEQIIKDANRKRFGFATAQITVIKGTAKHPRIVNGTCVRNYLEQIVIDLSEGIILETSSKGMLKPAKGCE